MMDIDTPYKSVRHEFHPLFGVRQNDAAGQFASLDEKRLRLKLIVEEFIEVAAEFGVSAGDLEEIFYRQAVFGPDQRNKAIDAATTDTPVDLVALAKELADLEYVTVGTLAVLGVNGDEAFYAVHKANTTKAQRGDDGSYTVVRREDGKVLKGPDYEPAEPDIERLIRGWKLVNMPESERTICGWKFVEVPVEP